MGHRIAEACASSDFLVVLARVHEICSLRLALFSRQALEDWAGFEEGFAVGLAELGDSLRKPSAFRVPSGVADSKALGGEDDVELTAVGGMGLAFDHAKFFERRDGGAHGLRFHAFSAGEFGGGGRAVAIEAGHYGCLCKGKVMRAGSGANAADELPDGLGQFDDGGFLGLSGHAGPV